MASIFTRIIQGEIPCYEVAQNEHCFAFLDIRPQAPGHTLVVPKQEIDHFFDMERALYMEVMQFCQQIAHAQKAAFGCERVCMAVIGFEVPHAHVHLIPANAMSDAMFGGDKPQYSPEQMRQFAEAIKQHLTA